MRRIGRTFAVTIGLLAIATAVMFSGASQAATTTPGPYPKIFLGRDVPGINCTDPSGNVVYNGAAWTIAPNIRGPLFAPTVLWLADAGNQPVVPLEFTTRGFPIFWQTDDGGTPADGIFENATGRPVAYGSVPTDTAPRITCGYFMLGHFDFGRYVLTTSMAAMLGIPTSLVGRTLIFDGEGTVTFSVPKYLFPTTAQVVADTDPTPDLASYPSDALPKTTCHNTDTGATLYSGEASTSPPLVRGYRWAPMAFWLTGDRIVTPRWFTSKITGTWHTAGKPTISGSVNVTQNRPPAGYGTDRNANLNVDCRYSGHDALIMRATPALVGQLHLPLNVTGKNIVVQFDFRVDALTGTWLFPPKS